MDRNENEIFGDRGGFTLLELILVIGIIIILATASFGIYQNYVSSVQFNAAREDIISNLKMTRESAMGGMYSDNWGINYVNAGGYYKIFYTPTTFSSASTVITQPVYLPSGISFTNPSVAAGSSTIIFTNTTGTTTTSSISITDSSNNSTTINITPSGTVY
jgi:type II secretory pathway pseudopilin PulG